MNTKKCLILVALFLMLLSVWPVHTEACDAGVPGSITVHKFNDANGNGLQDEGEEDIEGWLIRVYGWDVDRLISTVGEGRTDEYGRVTFTCEDPLINIKVWEETPECWAPTTPAGMNEWNGGHYVSLYPPSFPDVEVEFGNIYTCGPLCETELIAGQHWTAGTLSVSDDRTNLSITFDTSGTAWSLGETHLYVGTEPPTRSAPGRFPYGNQTEYTIPLSDFEGDTLYIAAHAVVTQGDQEETAWADSYGTPISERGSWALYFGYTVGVGCFEP